MGTTLRKLRYEKGISQDELAARAELNRTYYGDLERGRNNISVLKLKTLCEELDCSVADFFKLCQF